METIREQALAARAKSEAELDKSVTLYKDRIERMAETGQPSDALDKQLLRQILYTTLGDWHFEHAPKSKEWDV